MKVNFILASRLPIFRHYRYVHGFLYYTRTDFMPFETLKKRPSSFNVKINI